MTMSHEELRDRIGKRNFDPAEVEVICAIELDPPTVNPDTLFGLPPDMYDLVVEHVRVQREAWTRRNLELFGREFPGHRCEHCGNALKWGVAVKYLPTGQHFVVGETCADERMELQDRGQHDMRLVKMAAEHRAEIVRRAEAKARFYREHPAEAAYLYDEDRDPSDFLDDLARKLETYGDLTEKQLACVTRDVEKQQRFAAAKAEKAEQLADVAPLTEGRYEIAGRIVSAKYKEGYFADQSVLKLLVELPDGNRVYGTCPSSVESAFMDEVNRMNHPADRAAELPPVFKGTQIAFTAKVERSDDDEHFGFYSRPTKARVAEWAYEKEDKLG